MAYPFQQVEGLTQEQVDILRELNSFKLVGESSAWEKIIGRLKANVDEALEEMMGCGPETTLDQRGVLQLRWQQREAIRRDLLAFMQSNLDERQRVIDEIKEQHEYTSSDAGTDSGSNDQQ